MSTVLPLPLQLTQPVELTSSLEDALKEAFGATNTKYNHKSQVRETLEGVPMLYNGGSTSSNAQCNTLLNGIVTLDADVNIDDNDIL